MRPTACRTLGVYVFAVYRVGTRGRVWALAVPCEMVSCTDTTTRVLVAMSGNVSVIVAIVALGGEGSVFLGAVELSVNSDLLG